MNESLEKLVDVERDLFFALNGSDSVFLDNVMWCYSNVIAWIPLFLFLIYTIFYKTPRREAILIVVFIVLLFVACDQISSSVFKPFFHRYRPTHHPDFENLVDIVNGYRGGQFGFISGHATNSFGLAVFLSLVFRNRWVTLSTLLWAIINAYSRIYLGVHFISDILAGAIVGTLIAVLLYEFYVWCRHKFFHVPAHKKKKTIYSPKHAQMLTIGMGTYILLIMIFSPFLSTLSFV